MNVLCHSMKLDRTIPILSCLSTITEQDMFASVAFWLLHFGSCGPFPQLTRNPSSAAPKQSSVDGADSKTHFGQFSAFSCHKTRDSFLGYRL